MFDSSVSALPQVGERIEGGYTIQALLGQGGMGAVYRGVDEAGKPVALKFILPNRDPSGAMGLRFQREAQAMARIGKVPGIVPVHRAGTHGGCAYMVMGLIDGRDLMQQVKADGALTVEDALDLMAKVADSIHGCHEHQVLHRDLKPANVLVRAEDGEPFVTDFGLALIDGDSAPVDRLTKTGELMGTPAFMPPEQADGNKDLIGPCSDIYSLGALLFYLVCGRPPFEGKNLQILHALFKKDPPPLAEARGRPVPPDLQLIVSKAMAKEPTSRYATAGELAADLRRLRNGEPVTARAPGGWERFRWRLRQRDPRAVGALALALALPVVLVFSAALYLGADDPQTSFRDHVASLSLKLDEQAFPDEPSPGTPPLELTALKALAQTTRSLGEAISPPDPADGDDLSQRLEGLRARLARAPPQGEQAQLDALIPVLRVALELGSPRYADRPLAQAWEFGEGDPRGDVLAALALLGYGLDANQVGPATLEAFRPTPEGQQSTLQAQAREVLTAADSLPGRWGGVARTLAREMQRLEVRVRDRVTADYQGEARASEEGATPEHWKARERVALHLERMSELEEVLEGLLEDQNFTTLMENSERLATVYEVLNQDPLGAVDPKLDAAAERLFAFMSDNAEGFRVVDAQLVGKFARDYARSWGGLMNPPFAVIKEYRAWMLQRHMSGERLSVEDLLVSIRLGSEFGSMLKGAADRYLPLLEDYPEHERDGDFYFLWGMFLDLLDEDDETNAERQEVLEYYADALGDALSDRERARLGIQGERKRLAAPLSPIWVDQVKLRVYHQAIRLAFRRYREALLKSERDPAFDMQEAYATFANGVWALERFSRQTQESDLIRLNPIRLIRSMGRAIADMRWVTQFLPPSHGLRRLYQARFVQLTDSAQRVIRQLVKRLETNATQGKVSETEDLWTAAASPAQTVRVITSFTREEVMFLNFYGSADEALRRMHEQLSSLRDVFPGNYPYHLAEQAWGQARFCERPELARAVATHALEAQLPGLDDEREKGLQARDRFRAWFAAESLQRGDVDAAKAWLEATIEADRFNDPFWPDELLQQLGTTRAEVKARLSGR